VGGGRQWAEIVPAGLLLAWRIKEGCGYVLNENKQTNKGTGRASTLLLDH